MLGAARLQGRNPSPWQTYPAPSCGTDDREACVDQPDDNANGDYEDDGAIDAWLPELL